jgi:hypothetical protein
MERGGGLDGAEHGKVGGGMKMVKIILTENTI